MAKEPVKPNQEEIDKQKELESLDYATAARLKAAEAAKVTQTGKLNVQPAKEDAPEQIDNKVIKT